MKKLLLLLCTIVYANNGFLQIGVGTKAKGMGGTSIALPQDSFAAANNPAGLSMVYDRFDIGFDWMNIDAKLNDRSSSENVFWPEGAISIAYNNCFTFGGAAYLTGVWDVDYERLRSRYWVYTFTPALAYTINCCHSVGLGLNISLSRFKAEGLDNLIPFSAFPSDVTNRGREAEWGAGLRFGYIGHFSDCLILGAIYQTRTWLSRIDKYRGLLSDGSKLQVPPILGFGATYYPCSELFFSGDLEIIFWNAIDAFGKRLPTNEPLGAKGGPGLGWDNQVVLKLGLSYEPYDCLTLRAGWNYGSSPLGKTLLDINQVVQSHIRHHLTIGATYNRCCQEFSFAYIHGFEATESGTLLNDAHVRLKTSQNQLSFSYARIF